MSGGGRLSGRGPAALGRPVARRSPVVSFGGNKKPQLRCGDCDPGTSSSVPLYLWSGARDVRPHPPHGGAACAYTCSRRGWCESRFGHGVGCGGIRQPGSPNGNLGSLPGREHRAAGSGCPGPRGDRRSTKCRSARVPPHGRAIERADRPIRWQRATVWTVPLHSWKPTPGIVAPGSTRSWGDDTLVRAGLAPRATRRARPPRRARLGCDHPRAPAGPAVTAIPASFRAYVAEKVDDRVERGVRDFAEPTCRPARSRSASRWSSVNYKDGLATRADGKVARISPLIPGIDLAGEVVASADPVDRGRDGRRRPRLRARRLAPRRLRRVPARAGRLGRAARARALAARGDGDRDGRVHRRDVGRRARGSRAPAGRRARSS